MIDVHCHILPNVDDGSESMAEAIELARISAAEGVTHIIATPHPAPDGTMGSRVFTTERVAELNVALRENEIALEIFPGVETYIDPDMLTMLGSGRIFPLNNGRYVLVEFPYRQAPPSCEKILFAMRVAGYIPIIAHPERYQFVEKDPLWLGRAIEMGCLAQGTGAALWGAFGSESQTLLLRLIHMNMIHLIASDTHNLHRRPPSLGRARRELEALVGPEQTTLMVETIPEFVLHGVVYEPEPPPATMRPARPFWRFW